MTSDGEKKPDAVTQRGYAGLCASCLWSRIVESGKGSVFFLCGMSRHDPSFPKYPRLPVVRCRAFEPRTGSTTPQDPEDVTP